MGSDYYSGLQDRALVMKSVAKIARDIKKVTNKYGLGQYNYFLGTGNSGVAVASMLYLHIPYSGWGFIRKDSDNRHHGTQDHNDYDFIKCNDPNIWLVDDFVAGGETMATLGDFVCTRMYMIVAGMIVMCTNGSTTGSIKDQVVSAVFREELGAPSWALNNPILLYGNNKVRV